MSFPKGRQIPDNEENNYCSGHHNKTVVEKTSIPPSKNKPLTKELFPRLSKIRAFDIPEQRLISKAAERKSSRKRGFG